MKLKDSIAQNRAAIKMITVPDLVQLKPVLEQLREKTAASYAQLLKNSEMQKFTTTQYASMMVQLDDALKLTQGKLITAANSDLSTESKEAMKLSIEKMRAMVEAQQKKFKGVVTSLNLPVASVVASADKSLMMRHANSAKRYGGRVGTLIRNDIAIGVIRGETPDQIAKRILGSDYNVVKGKSATKQADAIGDKLLLRNEADARRLVTTEIAHAYATAQEIELAEMEKDDPGWQKEWDAKNDMKTCINCRSLNGKRTRPGGNFPGGVHNPPLHPHCRCTTRPVRREWD